MRIALICMFALSLSDCNVLQNETQRGHDQGAGWATPSSYTTADVRVITQRSHPNPEMGNQIICTEPSPDVSKALSTAAALTGQGGNGTASGSLSASGASAEAVAELAGRSTALLGLRDGLYRACEAYANGVIGQDAYALVLSRYGQLMTTLFLGQDITGAAGVASNAVIAQSVALQALGSQQGPGGGQPNNTTAALSPQPSPGPKTSSKGPNGDTPKIMLAALGPMTPGMLQGVDPKMSLAANPPLAPGALAATPPPAPAANPSPAPTNKGDASSTMGVQPSAAGASAGPALALTRMNEDFINLDANLTRLLVVACINENDPTRYNPLRYSDGTPRVNEYLKPICNQLMLAEIGRIETLAQSALTTAPYLRSVNPEVAAQPSAASGGGSTGTKAPATAGQKKVKQAKPTSSTVVPQAVSPAPPSVPVPLSPSPTNPTKG